MQEERNVVNTRCPITLAELSEMDPTHVYYHSNIGFDVFALYTYLTTSTNFDNPLTKTKFTATDVEDMEKQVKQLCGNDSIAYRSVSPSPPSSDSSVQGDEPTTVTLRVSIEPVNIELNSEGSLTPHSSSTSSTEFQESDDDSNELTLDISSVINEEDLPPSRCYPSLVSMYNNPGRTLQMKINLDLIQYFADDSTDVLEQIINVMCDDTFRTAIWEQTSPTVLEAVEDLVTDSSSVNVEVIFPDTWEEYRTRLTQQLCDQYAEVLRNMNNVNRDETSFLTRRHIVHVNSSSIPVDKRHWLISFISNIV